MTQSKLNRAKKRHRAYQLLSQIFADGLTPVVRSLVSDIPSLQPHLPHHYDADEASATYQDLFGFNVLPYAGVFLSEDGKLGGMVHYRLNSWYHSMDFEPPSLQSAPDHICTQLAFLAFLSITEIGAYKGSSQSKLAILAQERQAEFLQHEMFTWSMPFLSAIKAQGNAFYTEVAELTQALLISHLLELGIEQKVLPSKPNPENILDDPKTGFKQIAQYLVMPASSGVYFSKNDIKSFSGRLKIPSGFGDRVQLLSNALRSAITFDTLPAFLDALRNHVLFFIAEYKELEDVGNPFLEAKSQELINRAKTTLNLIEDLRKADLQDEMNE